MPFDFYRKSMTTGLEYEIFSYASPGVSRLTKRHVKQLKGLRYNFLQVCALFCQESLEVAKLMQCVIGSA